MNPGTLRLLQRRLDSMGDGETLVTFSKSTAQHLLDELVAPHGLSVTHEIVEDGTSRGLIGNECVPPLAASVAAHADRLPGGDAKKTIGDMLIDMILIAESSGVSFCECLAHAWSERQRRPEAKPQSKPQSKAPVDPPLMNELGGPHVLDAKYLNGKARR